MRMLDANTINRVFRSDFGMMVRIHRTLKNMTLRQLADIAGLSHTMLNKIELGQSAVTDSSLQRISQALNCKFLYNESIATKFETDKRTIHDAVYQGSLALSIETMERIDTQKDYHMLAPSIVEYMIIVVAMYNYPRFSKRDIADRYLRVLEKSLPLMTLKQQQYFYMYAGAFHYYSHDLERALTYFETAFEMRETSSRAALINYSRAMVSSELYKVHRADTYYTLALQGFERSNTMTRAMACRLFKAVNRIKIYDFEPFLYEAPNIIRYAEQTMSRQLRNSTYHYETIVHVLKAHFAKALDVAEAVDKKDEELYFYQAYAALRLNRKPRFNKILKHAEQHAITDDNAAYAKPGLTFLHAVSNPQAYENKTYQMALKTYFDVTVLRRDYLRTQLVYEYLNRHLVNTRQYKQAFELCDAMQRIIRQTMQ